jgi:hypothetical protein
MQQITQQPRKPRVIGYFSHPEFGTGHAPIQAEEFTPGGSRPPVSLVLLHALETTMKTTLLVLSLFLTTAAFAQYYGGGYINSQPQFYEPPVHPQHASYTAIAGEQTLMSGGSYTMGQGERPVSDFPQPPQMSLGEAARELRKQHEHDRKARVVWEN